MFIHSAVIIVEPNVSTHPRPLRRASDAGGVGCSAWLDRILPAVATETE